MDIELHYVGRDGTDRILPHAESVDLSPVFGDYGSFSFSYPASGKNFDLLRDKDEFEVQVYIDGVKQPKLGGLIKDVDGDDVNEAAVWKFTGLMYLCVLDEAVTFPAGWPGYDKYAPSRAFTAATAGQIMRTYLAEAQARGTITDVTFASFSSTVDSNGQPWAKQINIEVKPGVKLGGLAKNLLALGMAEFEMVGRELRMYNPGTLTVDRTVQAKPLTFRKGRDLRDSPRKRSSREVATVVLAAGKEDSGVYHAEVNTDQVAARRRIEDYVSNGNITDPGTLEAYAELQLAQQVQARMEKTHGLEFGNSKSPRPIDHFNVGDWVFSDVGRGLERLRVKQWVITKNADGTLSGSVTLNDLFAEMSERLNQRMTGIVGGGTVTGESKAVDRVPEAVIDSIAPKTPTGLGLASNAYTDAEGTTYASVTASWAQVTQNSDDTILEDLLGHDIEWQMTDVPGAPGSEFLTVGTVTIASWAPVLPNVGLRARIRAFDKAGNRSPWSEWAGPILTGADVTPPGQPAAPAVDAYVGLLRIGWNGLLASGAAPPPDFKHLEAHVSNVDGFTPTADTLLGVMTTDGYLFHKTPYFESEYVKFVAVDRSGNRSVESAQSVGGTWPVVDTDIFIGAVGTAKLADLAVTTAKINDLAVNNAKIGSMDVGKLTAGIMTAAVTVSGRIATALSGARTEFNSLGFFKYDAAGNAIVAIDNSGVLITGQYRTGLPGTRRMVMGATAATTSRIDFFSPTNDNGFIQSYTESSGIEAIQFGMQRGGVAAFPTLWNMLNINAGPAGEYTTMRSGTIELIFDGGDTQKAFDGTTPGAGRFVIYQAMDRGNARGIARFQLKRYDTYYWDGLSQEQIILTRDWTQLKGWVQLGSNPTPRLDMRREDGYLVHGGNMTGGYQEYQPNGNVYFSTPTGSHGWYQPLQAESSPHQRIMTGTGYGALIKSWRDTRGVALEFRQWDDSNFLAVRASNFEVNSDMRDKEDIKPAGVASFIDGMKAKPHKFKRKGDFVQDEDKLDKTKKGKLRQPAKAQARMEELGLMAQDLPDDIRLGNEADGYSYGQGQMNAWLWGAVLELSARVKELEAKK